MPSLPRLIPLPAVAALALATAPSPAHACGGFFCQIVVVDQNAERILFEVNGDGTVSTTVEIRYTGAAADFSWVVPVPDTPTLEGVPVAALQVLDAASAPVVFPANAPVAEASGRGGDDVADGAQYGGVHVEDLPQVGPYASQVISSDDPSALVDWLNENDYVITPEMEPFVEGYVASGMKFLGMKLASGTDVGDIAPIRMTYPADSPSIPLTLTSVSAEPEMSFVVFVLADQRYGSTNFVNLLVDDAHLRADPRTGAPTEPLAEVLGYTFLGVEGEEEAREWGQAALARSPYVTRLYTRMSNWEMGEDPAFGPVEGGDVSNVHDLSDAEPVSADLDATPAIECGTTYCGEAGLCAVTEIGEGCMCPSGFVARAIVAPRIGSLGPQDTVACQDAGFDLMASREGGIDGGIFDPCAGDPCGDGGSCVAVNGSPTCECADGFAAVNTGGAVTCAEALRAFPADQILWPGWPDDSGCSGCDAAAADPGRVPGLLALLGVAAGLAGLRRRRVAGS
ncbi:DUF2330 domain-containing protein [Myxococcota bacterium]|nr:DUF2330 domain-containing protein [Myxococcota bacterium]